MTIKLLVLDVDGVLTDGQLLYSAEGETLKSFNVQDGLGLKILRSLGVRIAVISGRNSKPLRARLDDLGIHDRSLGSKDKVAALKTFLVRLNVEAKDTAFMGDDLVDHAVMQACGYTIAPKNAVDEIKDIADFVTEKAGGQGAVREACEHLAVLMGTNLLTVMQGDITN